MATVQPIAVGKTLFDRESPGADIQKDVGLVNGAICFGSSAGILSVQHLDTFSCLSKFVNQEESSLSKFRSGRACPGQRQLEAGQHGVRVRLYCTAMSLCDGLDDG